MSCHSCHQSPAIINICHSSHIFKVIFNRIYFYFLGDYSYFCSLALTIDGEQLFHMATYVGQGAQANPQCVRVVTMLANVLMVIYRSSKLMVFFKFKSSGIRQNRVVNIV
jgi:hypothetical protein